MKYAILLILLIASSIAGTNMALAQGNTSDGKLLKAASPEVVLPPGITEEMLAPPPMPRFMLEKPGKPLTMEEMMQQAREAENRAGAERKPGETESKARMPNPAN